MRTEIFLTAVLLVCLGVSKAYSSTPEFKEVKNSALNSEGKLLDRDGQILQTLRLNPKKRQLAWIPLSQVSPALLEALTYVEDKRFYQHSGVDWLAAGSSIWDALRGKQVRGASTVTMQLLKFIEEREGFKGTTRQRVWEKVRQVRRALELESHWSKPEILEAYLNLVTFRGELRGIQSASRALFSKEPHGLNEPESFLLVSLLKSPNATTEKVGERLCLFSKERSNLGACEALKLFVKNALEKSYAPLSEHKMAFHLAKTLLTKEVPNVKSNLAIQVQRVAQESLEEQLRILQPQNVRDGAVVVLENVSGKVLAYVGGSKNSSSPQVDMARAPRQVGSTLKPFLYALAFERKILEPNSWLDDSPFESSVGLGVYHPENYNESFLGLVPAKMALGSSLNIPAVRTLELVGVDSFHRLLKKNGFLELREPEYYGFSLALGTADIDLLTLTNAYRTLAQNGMWSEISSVGPPSQSSHRVFSSNTATLVSSLLADPENRVYTFGWDSLLSTPYGASVKTGTSKDMRDNWCIGYTKDFTVGVWVGNATGAPMWQVSGISGAAPVWRTVMDAIQNQSATKAKMVAKQTPLIQPESIDSSLPKIIYPVNGSVLAIDPEIPESRQKVSVEVQGGGTQVFLDNQILKENFWKPIRGKHQLQLRSIAGEVLDQVSFQVRD